MNNIEINSIFVPDGKKSFHPHARVVGDFIYISGLIARLRDQSDIPGVLLDENGRVISQDVVAQFKAIMLNLDIILKEAGSSLEKVVDITVFMTNIEKDFKMFNDVYGEYFAEILPSRTTVEVSRFPSPVSIEIKVIAIK
jgi:2-aminomuconate deaminase